MSALYEQEKKRFQLQLDENSGIEGDGGRHAFETTPLFSLAVRYAGAQGRQCGCGIPLGDGESSDSDSEEDSEEDSVDSAGSDSDVISSSVEISSIESMGENEKMLPQYGLLGFHIGDHPSIGQHEPILLNTRAPNSTFLCGSQGSGKSYTLNCILENCLLSDKTGGRVATSLAGIAFHYDNEDVESGAEVASLCSRGIEVNVLVSSSNYDVLNEKYQDIARKVRGKINVNRLLLRDEQLSIERMHKLMNISEDENGVPLYVSIFHEILQSMAINGDKVTLKRIEQKLAEVNFAPSQQNMLDMRLRLLRSFMHDCAQPRHRSKTNIFAIKPGSLTIVDLSDPFVDASMVCTLFGICLSVFLKARKDDGLVVVLDEAHKYLTESSGAAAFTEQLLTTIRMQRHNGTRVVVATQEPTISGSLLDLCSVSIVHRFHVAGVVSGDQGASFCGVESCCVGGRTEEDI